MSDLKHSNVLITGHNGYLGSYLCSHLGCDTLEGRQIYNNDKSYDYVINCVGKPSIEYCEDHISESEYSNRDVIYDIHKLYPSAKIIHFSSYYVYDDAGLCTECSNTTRAHVYCAHKLDSELIVKDLGGVAFRVGKLFGHPDINKQSKLTEYIIQNSHVRVDNVVFNPTSLEQILSVIQYEIYNKCMHGVYNLSNKGTTTHLEWARLISSLSTDNKIIEEISRAKDYINYGKFAMSTEKIESHLSLRPFTVDLYKYMNHYGIDKTRR